MAPEYRNNTYKIAVFAVVRSGSLSNCRTSILVHCLLIQTGCVGEPQTGVRKCGQVVYHRLGLYLSDNGRRMCVPQVCTVRNVVQQVAVWIKLAAAGSQLVF